MTDDEIYMEIALEEARKAHEIGEVPIGALLVKDGEILARSHNLKEKTKDPTAHAEILAIQEGCRVLKTWRLTGTTLYVTVEPCPMCAGALIQARVKRLVFGTRDLKAGACGSLYNLVRDERFNHRLEIEEGVLEGPCAEAIQEFFKGLRK